MSRAVSTVVLLLMANVFMTFAWYGHLRFFGHNGKSNVPLFFIILFSWGIAFFEYCFQVPANRLGSMETGGPFSLLQLKIVQEVITLIVFLIFRDSLQGLSFYDEPFHRLLPAGWRCLFHLQALSV